MSMTIIFQRFLALFFNMLSSVPMFLGIIIAGSVIHFVTPEGCNGDNFASNSDCHQSEQVGSEFSASTNIPSSVQRQHWVSLFTLPSVVYWALQMPQKALVSKVAAFQENGYWPSNRLPIYVAFVPVS